LSETSNPPRRLGKRRLLALLAIGAILSAAASAILWAAAALAQTETTSGPATPPVWTEQGKIEGHLACTFSSDGAFSPDSSRLAVASDDEIDLMPLQSDAAPKVIKPHLEEVRGIEIRSVNFVSAHDVFVLANGIFHTKRKSPSGTPLMGFQWNVDSNQLDGKINAIGASGGFSPARYFPAIGYLSLYKDGKFELWKPAAGLGAVVELPDLQQIPNLYEFSPDGHWLLLAQIQTTSNADPSVVRLKDHKFVDELRGHEGTVMSMAFSHDSSKVVTTCEDGNLRVYSTGDWKLLLTLSGHHGAVHRAEFTPNGKWIVSVGEDHSMRIWSAEDGSPLQTLQESSEPLVDLGISPDSRFIAAATDKQVYIWQRQGGA
jgi:WD40 repeat protein